MNLPEYKKRIKRVSCCVNLRETDRTPIIPVMEA